VTLAIMITSRTGGAARLLPTTYRRALDQPGVRPLVAALGAASLGDGMSAVTVAWLALRLAAPGHAGVLVGVAVAAASLPGALGAPLLGRIARGMTARHMMLWDCAVRAVLLGAIPVAACRGALNPVDYVALLAGSSVPHAWGSAGQYTLLARLVPADLRMAANSLVGTAQSAAVVIGPATAGVLVAFVGPEWLIGVDALSYAALGVTALASRAVMTPAAPERGRAGSALRGLPASLLGLLALTWLYNFIWGPVEVALPLHVTADLHAPASLLGTYWSVYGVGAVIGGFVGGALRRLPIAPTILGIVAGWGVVLLPFALPVPVWVTVVCFGVGGVVFGPFVAMSLTLFQARTPPDLLADVLAVRAALNLTASPLGTVLGGPLTSALGPRPVIWGSGALTIVLAACGALGWLTLRRRVPALALVPAQLEPRAESLSDSPVTPIIER
jgi:MFS family permease